MNHSFEQERQGLIGIVGELYARGTYSEDRMNEALERIASASSIEELKGVMETLPAVRDMPGLGLMTGLVETPVQIIAAKSGVVRKTGEWLRSRTVRVEGVSSSVKLDFMSYAGTAGLVIELDLELRSTALTVTVPANFTVDETLTSNQSSNVKVRLKESGSVSNRLILRGAIRSSTVKIVGK